MRTSDWSSDVCSSDLRWFTNLDNNRRHGPIELTRHHDPNEYPRYENYDAIEVSRTQNIPLDYEGLMGVPITFLDKYSPDQFEIVMLANGNARTHVPLATLEEELGSASCRESVCQYV